MIDAALLLLTLLLAVLAIETKELMYAVISFCAMCVVVGLLFAFLNAPYAALFQIIIYAGAIVVLFIFAIMLTERGR